MEIKDGNTEFDSGKMQNTVNFIRKVKDIKEKHSICVRYRTDTKEQTKQSVKLDKIINFVLNVF